jgi:MFS-type transporter involved in bile tolerance (Atg22 family)
MKTRRVASMMPLLASIGFGIIALATPFLVANHYIMVDNKSYNVDNYLFFFYAKYYTVTGVNMIQSQTAVYDFGDFPIYSMAAIIIGMALEVASIFGGRGIVMNVKGRVLKMKLDTNPVYLQVFGLAMLIMSYIYLGRGSALLGLDLEFNNYVVENGPAVEFLFGSIIALSIATIMTGAKYLKEEKSLKKNAKVSTT